MTQTESPAPDQATSAEELLIKLQEHVFVVSLHIGWPKLSPHIAEAEVNVHVDGDTSTKVIDAKFRSNPRWQLIPDEWRTRLSALEGRARRRLASASQSFDGKGLSLLPISKATEVFRDLKEMREEFMRVADGFCNAYEQILEDLKTELGEDLFKQAGKRLPSLRDVRSKFAMKWCIIPMGRGTGNIRSKVQRMHELLEQMRTHLTTDRSYDLWDELGQQVDGLLAAENSDLETRQANELIDEARRAMRTQVDALVNDMVAEPRAQLAEGLQHLVTALQNNQQIKQGTFTKAREALQKLEGFQFLATDQVKASLQRVRGLVESHTSTAINSDRDLGLRLAAALHTEIAKITDVEDIQRATHQFRCVRIREEQPVAG